MNAKLTILVALFTTACSSGGTGTNDELLDEYEAAVTAVHELTDAYVVDASTSSDVVAVGDRQATYQMDMEAALGDIEHVLEDLEGCQMMGDGMDRIDEARGSSGIIWDSLDAMLADHTTHADVRDCQASAEAHEVEVDAEVDSMESHHDVWHDMSMECGDHDGNESSGDQ